MQKNNAEMKIQNELKQFMMFAKSNNFGDQEKLMLMYRNY